MAISELICSYYTVAGHSPVTAGASSLPFPDRVRACAEAGYVGVGVHLRDYISMRRSGVSDATLRAVLQTHGMRHVETEFLLDWFADGEAGVRARKDEETLYHIVEALGARVMFLTGDLKPDSAMPFDQLQESFAALCQRAGERGVTIGVEPCAWSNIGDVDTAVRLIDGSGAKNAGLFLDLWHLYRRGIAVETLRSLRSEIIVGIQLDDAAPEVVGSIIEDCLDRRLPPGDGAAGAVDFVALLAEIGVDSPISVELISEEQRARSLADAARVSFDAARRTVTAALRQPRNSTS